MAAQCALLRDIFRNPFHSVSIDGSWLVWNNGLIPRLTKTIYAERAFDQMPILADALEDAGCTDAAILNHCRSDGPHVLGCWLIDLLLAHE
jgi:hypothetical protein